MKSIFLFFFLNSCVFYTQAQKVINVSGTWNGSYSYLGKNYPLSYKLLQNGNNINGTIRAESKDSTKYIIYKVKGNLEGSDLTLTGIEIIKKTYTLGCMSKMIVHFTQKNGYQLMEGKWKPFFHKGGCPIGASGNVSLVKNISKVVSNTNLNNTEKKGTSLDIYTQEMIKKLKERRFHALIISENKYADPLINSLDNPINDGQKLIKVLTQKYNFDQNHILHLKNPKRVDILRAFEQMDTLNEFDNLLIFYAGHGYWDTKLEQGYWLPSDASKNSRVNWISNSTIRDHIKALKTKHTLLIADACFSGGLLKTRGLGKSFYDLYNLPSRKAMTSGALTEVPDKSIFLEYLVTYLTNYDQPLISADQLFFKVKIDVIHNSPYSQVPQYGQIMNANDEGGEFIFLNMKKRIH